MFKSKLFLLALTCLTAFSCSSETTIVEEENKEEVTPQPEPDPQPESFLTSFKFITVNNSSMYSDPASLSYISHSGEANPDIYQSANNKLLENSIAEISRINDKFIFTYSVIDFSTYYSSCYLEIVDTATFRVTDVIDLTYKNLGYELLINSSAKIDDNHIVTGGTLFYAAGGDGDNIAIISLKDKTVKQHARLEFPIHKVIHNKGKVFTFGARSNGHDSKFAVLNTDNITAEPRIILSPVNLFAGNPPVIEAKGMIWIAAIDTQGPAVFCINPETETIAHRIALPYTISSLTSVGITMDKTEENLFIRAGRAFYRIDTKTLEAPDDVEFEVTSGVVDGGMQCLDLKTAPDGKLLFIREISGKGEICKVYEVDPTTGDVTNIYPTNINSRYLYIAK
ncbi:MAG: hypothetical protein ACRDDZ_09395 [Marinifilaceae bacterium]